MVKRALIITVGTGETAPHGIAHTIYVNKPGYIVFVVTRKSKERVKSVIDELMNSFRIKWESGAYTIREIENEESYDECYETAKSIIEDLRKDYDDIFLNFTFGTKPMAAGLLFAGVLMGAKNDRGIQIQYTSGGKRDKNGKVISGTERVVTMSSFYSSVLMDMNKSLMMKMFNNYAFEEGLRILEGIKQRFPGGFPENLEFFIKKMESIFHGYSRWDKFDHLEALEYLRKMEDYIIKVQPNKQFLLSIERSLNGNDSELYKLMMVDIFNNANRRIEEGKYDDAVARLYRLIEMIGQYCLSELNIDTSNVDLSRLMELNLDEATCQKYEKLKELSHDGKIKLPLYKAYELLHDIYNANPELPKYMRVGSKFLDDRKIQDLLSKRNESILAHGKTPVNEKTAKELCERTKEYLALVVKDLDKLLKKSQFPKFPVPFF